MRRINHEKKISYLVKLISLDIGSVHRKTTSDAKTSSEQSTVQKELLVASLRKLAKRRQRVVDKRDHYSIQGKYDGLLSLTSIILCPKKIITLEKILPQKARTVKTYCSNAASRITISIHYN